MICKTITVADDMQEMLLILCLGIHWLLVKDQALALNYLKYN